jgi:response regulator RpfG family c-di-GMP phosphodiesterase
MTNRKVLIVDDDPHVLQAYKRQLRRQFEIDVADSGPHGLEALAASGPYAVIVSDMRMPQMNGVQFLAAAKTVAPDTLRIMLTGNADQQTAIDAVNNGQVFRFLCKPCLPDVLATTIELGVERYRLVTGERELLTKTLNGSVSLLTEVLSLVNPVAFGRATRVKGIVSRLCERLAVENAWEIELAAMLSHVGCVTVPEQVLTRFYSGDRLPQAELRILQGHPATGRSLVAKIPRLEGVAELIALQDRRYDNPGGTAGDVCGEEIPLGGRILKLALDFDALVFAGKTNEEALVEVRSRDGWYDPQLLTALAAILDTKYEVRLVSIEQLEPGMILDEHVLTDSGDVLLAAGQHVLSSTRERLRNFSKTSWGVREPIRVRCSIGAAHVCAAAGTRSANT